jgi:hypothetical protein
MRWDVKFEKYFLNSGTSVTRIPAATQCETMVA